MPQNNFLVIGLGGTGCAVIRELKKKLYIEWRSRGNTGPYPEIFEFHDTFGGERVESRIGTVSVDSNEKDLQGQGERDRKWRVFGDTLRLTDREKVLLDPSGLDRILGSVERYPGIEPWIRDEMEFVREITRGSTEPAGCNQIRRMGRLALATGNGIDNVINRVADRLTALSRGGQVGAQIHIACTIAAGTGSGTLIDVIAQLQRHLKNQPGSHEIFVHGFTTAKDVGNINTGNFYANQYAAILELNAFRLARYRPWNITAAAEASRLVVPEPGETSGDLPGTFRSAALISETTEGGVDVPLDRQVENAAEFVFQLAVRQMGDAPKVLRDALTLEDRAMYPADVNGGDRSTAFIGYGVQRVAIPEREIREKLSYSFGRQFLLKVLYANWDDRYRESAPHFSRDGFVDERRGMWRVNQGHLYLDLVEDAVGQREFEQYETEWRGELTRHADRVKQQLGDKFPTRQNWLSDFDRRARNHWEKGFRSRGDSGGVIDYFQIRREPNEVRNRARRIRGAIESDLLQNMERMDPTYALTHLPGAVEFLVQRVDDDRVEFGNLATKAVEQAKAADRVRGEIRGQCEKCGRWAKGKLERLFGKYRDATVRFYYWWTIQYAAEYGQVFCNYLIGELKLLYKQIARFDTRMKQIATHFEEEIRQLIPEERGDDDREEVVFLVDARYINDAIRNRFESDKSVQDAHADATIEALKQLRGDRIEFAAYTEKMPVDEDTERVGGQLVDELRRVSETNAIDAHSRLIEDDPEFEGIFGQNIIRKLYNDYGGQVDGEMEQWLRDLMDRAMPMIAFDPNEEPMDLPTQGPVLRRCVFVPTCRAVPDDFERQLRQKIESIIGGKGSCKRAETFFQEVPEERNPSEIAIVSVAFFFPARHTRVVHGLKERYKDRLRQKSEKESRRAYFEVHTESHHPPLPDLMKLARKEVLDQRFPSVLLATALGFMRVPDENGQQILFGTVDSFGRVIDKVETGMKMNSKVREAADQSPQRFGQEIPVETILLHLQYKEHYAESGLTGVDALIQRKMMDDEVDIEEIEGKLERMGGQSFLLSGKKEDDPSYKLFDTKVAEAIALARRLADKSSL